MARVMHDRVAELLGVSPGEINALSTSSGPGDSLTVDETGLAISLDELATLETVAASASDALEQLQSKSSEFESDIRQLSGDMNALENQSSSLHNRLQSRDIALQHIEPLLDAYVIPASIVQEIFTGEIGPKWYAALAVVEGSAGKLFNEQGPEGDRDSHKSRSREGARHVRQILLARAVERGKGFYVAKLRTLRRPGVNAQLVQAELVQARPILEFLRRHTPRLSQNLGRAYRNTMRWYYTMLFGKYGRWLDRQPLATADAHKTLGSAASQNMGGIFTISSSAKKLDTFNIGARPTVVRTGPDVLPALPMTAEPPASQPYYTIEVLVRSMLVALSNSFSIEAEVTEAMQLAALNPSSDGLSGAGIPPSTPSRTGTPVRPSTPETSALPVIPPTPGTPFGPGDTTEQVVSSPTGSSAASFVEPASFLEVFEPTLTFYGEVISKWIANSSADIFGLMLVSRLLEQSPLQQWIHPWLSKLIEKCIPRILAVCSEQAKSIEDAALKPSLASTSSAEVAVAGPSPMTQLVSVFLSGILQLCPDEADPQLARAIREIVGAYELYISKLAKGNEAILYNNYFVMSALLSDIEGSLAQEFANHFQLLVGAHSKTG